MATFVLTAEQEALQRAARGFVRERLPVSHLRKLRDRKDPMRLSREVWTEMAGLGWAGIAIAEQHGGAGLGLVEIGLVAEELGRTLAPTPLLATSVLGAGALAAAPEALREEVLPEVAQGQRLLALAFEERPRFALGTFATTARRAGSGWRLDGEKLHVLDGGAADQLIVAAGDGLFLVDRDAPGLAISPRAMVDSRAAAHVRLGGVVVPEERRVGDATSLAPLVDRATAVLCAEMLGGLDEVFARTIAYLKERKQFGVPIGSFQALKHRAAKMFCEVELTRSVVRAALAALDAGGADGPHRGAPGRLGIKLSDGCSLGAAALVSAAKAKASDTFLHVAEEAIQLHGGIGVTDELDIGFYLKRARVCELTFGAAAYHRDRFGRLNGY
jgi:alkylation response protein AidB-like acyl-CoA dehydrogenase